jgi:uncharacterized LabA/DUF88 family protein
MDKMSIFIDGGYLDKILTRDFGKAKIDYEKLQSKISINYDLLRTYYYCCPIYRGSTPTLEEKEWQRKQDQFHYNLNRITHFQVRKGYLKRYIDSGGAIKYEQKLIDVLFAVDLTRLVWQKAIQRAAIITGDGDFVPAIEDIKNAGVVVSLYYTRNACAEQLINICDERYIIDQTFIDSILYRS